MHLSKMAIMRHESISNAFDVDARVSTGAGRDSFIEFIEIEEELLCKAGNFLIRLIVTCPGQHFKPFGLSFLSSFIIRFFFCTGRPCIMWQPHPRQFDSCCNQGFWCHFLEEISRFVLCQQVVKRDNNQMILAVVDAPTWLWAK